MDRIIFRAKKEAGRTQKPTIPPVNPPAGYSNWDFEFDQNPSRITRETKTEWRIKHVGTRTMPRYRWRRRKTYKITIEGGMFQDKLKELERKIAHQNRTWGEGGICWQILNAQEFGIDESPYEEFYVFEDGVSFNTTRMGKDYNGIFMPWCTYKLSGKCIWKEGDA